MKRMLPAILGGIFAGASVWTAQALDAPFHIGAVSAAAGGFLGTFVGQILAR